jgi:hypothetical protein
MSFPLMPFVPPRGAVRFSFRGMRENASNLTTYTFSAVSLIEPSSTRAVIVLITADNGAGNFRSISSVTIGGVSATLYENVSTTDCAAAAVAVVPSGLSVDVVVTMSGGSTGMAIAVWQMDNYQSIVPHDTARTRLSSQALTISLSCEVPAGGFGCFFNYKLGTENVVWSGAVELDDQDVGGQGSVSAAQLDQRKLGVDNATRTATWAGSNRFAWMIGAAFK